MKFNHICQHIIYAVRTIILNEKIPYLGGIVLTDKCNLDCFYCVGRNLGLVHANYDETLNYMKKAYERGVRYLYFTGGEPFCWDDRDYDLKSIINVAKKIGFFDIFVATNGTYSLDIADCMFYVSLDGTPEIHNKIKGNTYDKIMANIVNASSKRIYITFTLTKNNESCLEKFTENINVIKKVKGIFINFFTGDLKQVEQYGLSTNDRNDIIGRIIKLKKKGYPFAISYSALEAFRNNNWTRPLPYLEIYCNGKIYTCCRDVNNKEVCLNCGYGICAEISQILKLKPDAILEMFRL